LCLAKPSGRLWVMFWLLLVADRMPPVPAVAKPGADKGRPRSGNRLVGSSRHNIRSVELVPRDKHARRPVAGVLSYAAFACGLKSTLRP
jgi:hypothetical protein